MKTLKLWLATLIAFVFCLLLMPNNALACACCSEPGTYRISTPRPDSYKLDLLGQMKFVAKTELHQTPGEDNVKGLGKLFQHSSSQAPETEPLFNLSGMFASKSWKLNFKSSNGQTGTLTLPLPQAMVSFAADIHDGKAGGGGGPLLYKEWRFKGNVASATGVFQAGIVNPTTYFLVFQGRGNNCDNAEDFTNWRVEINGKKADYAFYGEMASGSQNR